MQKNHQLRPGSRTNMFTKSTGRTKKTRIRFSKTVAGAISRTGISHEERTFRVDSMHMMSMSNLTHEEQERFRKSKEFCTITTANGSITTTEEATVYVRDLGMFITVQLSDGSPAVLSLCKCCEAHWFSTHGRKHDGKIINCKFEKLCTNGRTRSHCRHKPPKRCR